MSYCFNCGDVVTAKFCANCGTQTREDHTGGEEVTPPVERNVLQSNFPSNRMAMSYARNFPQRNFLLWFIASIAVLPLSLLNIFGGPLGIIVSGIVYGAYTYFLMTDFTKYIEDMKQKDKVISTIELPFELTWFMPLLIVTPYGLHFVFFIFGNILNLEMSSFTPLIIVSFFYCVPGIIFLYLKHKVMEDITRQALEQQIFSTPISVKNSSRPAIIIGILYACLFILLIAIIAVFESQIQPFLDYVNSGDAADDAAAGVAIPNAVLGAFALLVFFGLILVLLLTAMFGVWTYYEYQWHTSLYQLIRDSHLTGVLGDNDMSGGVVSDNLTPTINDF